MNGKGDKRRPAEITHEQYEQNWNTIFGPKPKIVKYPDTLNGELNRYLDSVDREPRTQEIR